MTPAQKAWETRKQKALGEGRDWLAPFGRLPQHIQDLETVRTAKKEKTRLRRNAAARARYQICKDLGLSRTRNGGWE